MTCNVILTNSQEVYYSGEIISGIVACTFHDNEHIRGIRVKLRGKEHTDHVERKSYFDRVENKVKYKDVHYMGGNRFLEIVNNLIEEGTITNGQYEYPFSFTLPEDLPSSYQGKYAYIQYYIKANVDRPFAIDYRAKVEFNVHSPIDFNKMTSNLAMNPVTYRKKKTLGLFCCASGPITILVDLEKTAFVQGEVARVTVNVQNMTDKNVEKIMVNITRTIQARSYRKQSRYRYENVVLASAMDSGVDVNKERNYEFNLKIPGTGAIYNLTRCLSLKQWCTLSVVAVLPIFQRDLKVKTNLTLGHIPIGGFIAAQNNPDSSALSSGTAVVPPTYSDVTRGTSSYSQEEYPLLFRPSTEGHNL